ncbi:MAG: PepSY-associated TM helix domain-containing protein, partial [Myxococcota bacterium]
MKKLIGKLHLWLGLASGVVVFVVSDTGCLYLFLDDLESVLHRRERFVQVRPEAKLARPSEVFASIRRTFPARAFENVYYTDYAEEGRVHSVWAYDGEEEAYEAVWVHPETAEVTRTYTYAAGFSEDFAGTLIELHTSLMLGDVGREIVGVSTLVFVVMMFSGLVLWWPRTWRALKPRLTLKLSGGQKRVNYDLHNVLGFYVGWVLLIIALTGLVWAYEWVSHAVQWTVNGGVVTHTEPAELKVSEVSSDRALTAVDAAYGELLETLPPQHHFVLSE